MINEQLNIEVFGYKSTDIGRQSAKSIVAICNGCGRVRFIRKSSYRDLCSKCSSYFASHEPWNKGGTTSDESKRKNRESHLGKPTWNKGLKGAQSAWNKGLTKETSEFVAKNALGVSKYRKGKPLPESTIEKLRGRPLSIEHRRKLSIAMSKYFDDPKNVSAWEETSGRCNKKHVQGHFRSCKNQCDIYFQSSYELYAYIKLEHDNNVKLYGRCCFSIVYLYNGEANRYIPDIYVEFYDGKKVIIEVKPTNMINIPANIAKFNAGRNYCHENNMQFLVWTETNIE